MRRPRISIVTPTFNQASFLEACIESVASQGYPDVEHIVIDGGSTDGTPEVLRRQGPRLALWVSEPDRGQSHAINKGFARATGEIFHFLNSDDLLAPGALERVAGLLGSTTEPAWVTGAAHLVDRKGRIFETRVPGTVGRETFLRWAEHWFPSQGTFWTRPMWERAGPVDESLHFTMDLALWERMFRVSPPVVTREVLGVYRFHEAAKSIRRIDEAKAERAACVARLLQEEIGPLLRDPDGDTATALCQRIGALYEEASDCRVALAEIEHHPLIGRILGLWRRSRNPWLGRV